MYLYASPAASSALLAFFGNGFWRMPTTTISFAATAAWTSFTISAPWLATFSRAAGWILSSGRMLRAIALILVRHADRVGDRPHAVDAAGEPAGHRDVLDRAGEAAQGHHAAAGVDADMRVLERALVVQGALDPGGDRGVREARCGLRRPAPPGRGRAQAQGRRGDRT